MTTKTTETPEQAWKRIRGRLRLAALAKDLGVSRGYLAQWKAVPEAYVDRVSELTGIPRERLRPDPWSTL